MSDWQLAFGEIDDDYLTGISNKGIVKRAYKDLETIPCMAAGQNLQEAAAKQLQDMAFAAEEVLELTVGEETVQIRLPFGESTCSCPSRSICRHVVQGILAMKAAFAAHEVVENKTAATANETVEAEKEAATSEAVENKSVKDRADKVQSDGNKTIDNANDIDKTTKNKASGAGNKAESIQKTAENAPDVPVTMIEKVAQQIADYPLAKLCKSLGTRRIQEVIGAAKTGRKPQITYSSVVTVQPIAKSMTVKLLFPLEHATCTCHKKEFCVHKAEAVLWCKLESGQLGIQDLEGTAADYDMEQVHEAASQMRTVLEELFDTGLSRTADDVTERMERLAVISHNAKLANFESDWRRMQDSYQKYMKRVATLGIPNLMRQITRLYRNVERLAQAQNALEVSALAGVFRSEYTPALDLDLVGIALEHFVSKSGYEGDTVYFLEETTKRWYTYTQARPVFYEKEQSLYYYGGQRYTQETPWGLPVPFRELAACQFHLEHAKSDSRGRLSSSKETKGRLIRERDSKNPLTAQLLGKWYYRDFAQLFQEMFCAAREAGAEEADHSSEEEAAQTKLVILRPSSCDPAVFSDTEQKLRMKLYDEAGKAVVIEITYSKDEAEGIRYLEKITDENLPCFFGKIYLQDGRIKLYPIAVFGKRELQETDI